MASLIQRGKNKTFYVQYRENNVLKRVSTHTTKKKIASEILNKYKVAEQENKTAFVSRKSKSPKLGEFIERYLQHEKLTLSKKWHYDKSFFLTKKIVPYFGEEKLLSQITQTDIEEYRIFRTSKVSNRTINIEVNCLLSLLRKAVEWNVIDEIFIPKVKKLREAKNRLRFLEQGDIISLLEICKVFSNDMYAYVTLMLNCGLRSAEALHLKWSDIDFNNNIIEIIEKDGFIPKNRNSRTVPINTDFKLYLQKRKDNYPNSEYIVLCDNTYTTERLKRLFTKVVEMAGLPTKGEHKVTAHTLRHTFASHLVMAGTPLYTVGKLLGHSDPKTTQIYAHLAPDHLRNEIQKLHFMPKDNE